MPNPAAQNSSLPSGWIEIPEQFASYPFVSNLHFADKKDLSIDGKDEQLDSVKTYLAASRIKYQQFVRQKNRLPSLDAYASFQPFNEAFKALFPFIDYLKSKLEKGDEILNLWDRSGWTASMLAAWFPEQHIITVWEGDKDILGYRGFYHWMNPETNGRSRLNHTVIFHDFNRPLPVGSSRIALVIGLDVLHRFYQPEMLSELNRVCKPEAPMIFPHVHLTNSMPEPFFERGCRQLHGNDYERLFEKFRTTTHRRPYIMSEPGMFWFNEYSEKDQKTLVSEPFNSDYNACIAWLPDDTVPYIKPWKAHEQKNWLEMLLLRNPLLMLDPADDSIKLRDDVFAHYVNELLDTHPIYVKRLSNSLGNKMTGKIPEILYWAARGIKIKDIIKRVGVSILEMKTIVENLYDLDFAQAVPVDEPGFRLQHLLGEQQYLFPEADLNLSAFWSAAIEQYRDNIWLKQAGEDPITYSQGDELIALLRSAMYSTGLRNGDRIFICTEVHTEAVICFWAAVTLGITVVPISPRQSPARLKEYQQLLGPKLIITEPALFQAFERSKATKVIMIDRVEENEYDAANSFESWLEGSMETRLPAVGIPGSNDIAVILFTTGSTNSPKAVPLTHRQLILSGRAMTETYHWKSADKYFALGGLETMSGLRHLTVSVAETGSCCIMPKPISNVFEQFDIIQNEEVTIVTANPAYFKQLLFAARRGEKIRKSKLRLALCTGNQLRNELREEWESATGISLCNYYGLTETSGICVAQPLNFVPRNENSIGFPVDCIIRIVDPEGNKVQSGEKGELCVYGTNVFERYLNNEYASSKCLENGWFHTGDLAIQNSDGEIILCGRLSDIVKLPSGNRIELSAIEEVLHGMKDLSDYAVCQIHDHERESIAVFLVPESKSEFTELVHAVQQNVEYKIGSYAIPSVIMDVESIPRGNHNKVIKSQLLELHQNSIKNYIL